MATNNLIQGIGINDLDYQIGKSRYEKVNGKLKLVDSWFCPYYKTWSHMFDRAYAERYSIKESTYFGVTVCENWVYASSFVGWMKNQVWQGLELDKDILIPGNKIYSPDTCRFVPKVINAMVSGLKQGVQELPMGVHRRVYVGKRKTSVDYSSHCRSIFFPEGRSDGFFKTVEDAHKHWQENKAKAFELAVEWWYTDPKYMYSYQQDVADSLLGRASKLKEDANLGVTTKWL